MGIHFMQAWYLKVYAIFMRFLCFSNLGLLEKEKSLDCVLMPLWAMPSRD
jgi:hypothetical protein